MATNAGILSSRPRNRMWRTLGIIRRWPVIPGVILTTLALCAIFAPILAPRDPLFSVLRDRNTVPMWYDDGSSEYIIGADPLGRDLLSRIVYGARVSLTLALGALVIGLTAGTVVGIVAGYGGGLIDEILMRLVDVSLAVPFILVALVVVIALGQSYTTMFAILAFSTWGAFARQVRGEVLQLKEMDYVALARVAGASPVRISIKHLMPGLANTLIVVATFRAGLIIMTESVLSFLGAGVPPPTPSWGVMVSAGRDYLATAWWVAFFPGMAILLTVLALNFLGDWLRDRLDPRLRQL